MIEWSVVPIIFFAYLVQSIAGFGSGLIAMPLLISILGLETAAPTFALVAQTGGLVMLLKYRSEWEFEATWHLLLMSAIGIPLGVIGASIIDEHTVKLLLGCIVLAYASYSLLGMQVPHVNSWWGLLFGFLSGLLSGAYNTGGPPLVVYGNSQEWQPAEFKVNLNSIFFPGTFVILLSHGTAGNFAPTVFWHYAVMAPALIVAMLIGFSLDDYVNPSQFRKGVLGLLLLIGVNLIV